MRSVRIVVRQIAGSVPALVAASVLGSAACDDPRPPSPPAPTGGTGASSSAGGPILTPSGGSIALGGSGESPVGPGCEGYVIELPDAGLPAAPESICTFTMEPIMNSSTVRLTLEATPEDLRVRASGTLTVAPELREAVLGAPAIQLVSASEAKLLDAELSELEPSDEGYTFTVTWPEGAVLQPEDATRVSFRTALDVSCPDGSMLVHAVTEVHLCGGFAEVPSVWASPGDSCAVCRVIAELAASPIIPEHQKSDLPLGQAMRARVVELARVGGSVVLFAENDGGESSSYEWHPSSGSIEQVAPDVVVWRLDPDDARASMQVAIVGDAGVAVVSYAFEGGLH